MPNPSDKLSEGEAQGLGVPPSGSGSHASHEAGKPSSPSVSIPDAVRDVIAEANNSLYGSQGFFLSTNGGEPDKYHLARPIEELKAQARREWRRAAIYEVALRAISEFSWLGADRMNVAHLARDALASGIEAAKADETRSGSAEGESPTAEGRDAQPSTLSRLTPSKE